MASKINWSLIKDYESFTNQVQLVTRIGKGANGIVYKAIVTQGQHKYTIAVKKIELNNNITNNQISNLNKENKFLNAVNNTNIMKVYFKFAHLTKLEKQYYIGMEYGFSDLNSIISHKGQQTENEISALAQQLWNGLNYLEENQAAHRDLKPENVILSQDGTYKLCDFGEVKFSNQTFKTAFQSVAGTPPYLAPELIQAFIKNEVNTNYHPAKSDTFSYGVLLLQTLMGLSQQGIQFVNTNPQISKDFLKLNCSESFKWFLQKCLEFNPQNRWTFKDMKDIFNLNPIEAYYQLTLKNKKIRKLEESLNLTSSQSNEIKQLNLQIKNLNSKNNQLTQELQKIQQQQSKMKSSSPKIHQQEIIQTLTKTKAIIQKCKDNEKAWINKFQTDRKNAFTSNTKGLKWIDYYYYHDCSTSYNTDRDQYWNDKTGISQPKETYWRFTNGDPMNVSEKDISAAIKIAEELEKATGFEFGLCLRMLHSNLWDFQKSENDLLN